MRKALVIPPEGRVKIIALSDNEVVVTGEIQKVLDGYLELVRTPHPEIVMFCNEHGKMQNRSVNIRATVLARIPGDVIVGTTVICGAADANGNVTSIPDEWVLRLYGEA